MAGRKSTGPLCVAMALALTACSDYADYPGLVPMDQLTAEPALPASAAEAVTRIASATPHARILICGSLYLAGRVLRENG